MSSGAYTPFHLRQNKSVDRELFLGLLSKLGACLDIERYCYIGMGGAFLEDFRLVHARLGIVDLVCVESSEDVHKRQQFNRPVSCITLKHETIERYMNTTKFDCPVILWLDYTNSKGLKGKINSFCQYSLDLPIGSILRVTLNANSDSLDETFDELDFGTSHENATEDLSPKDTLWQDRAKILKRFKSELGPIVPIDLTPSDMSKRNYGKSLLRTLRSAINGKLKRSNKCAVWMLSTLYADGEQQMVTATILIGSETDQSVNDVMSSWEYVSEPDEPLVLDMPVLSTLERLTMASCDDPKEKIDYKLHNSNMGMDPFVSFKKYYRFFPHFSRVEP